MNSFFSIARKNEEYTGEEKDRIHGTAVIPVIQPFLKENIMQKFISFRSIFRVPVRTGRTVQAVRSVQKRDRV